MTERYGSYPPDEPIIGADYPPASQPSSQQDGDYIGGGQPWAGVQGATGYADDNGYDGGYSDEYDDEYDEYYDDDYYEESPARQPIFYVFIGLAVLLGGGLIFVLFSLFGAGDNNPKVTAGFNVRIDTPANNERVEIGKPKEVVVQASSNEQITRFDLMVAGKSVDQLNVSEPGANGIYSATLKYTFERTGEYELFVRVTSISGATKDSDKVKVVAIQPVGDKPVRIKGKIIGQSSVRRGPGDNFEVLTTLNPGEEVDILAKTRDGAWLLINVQDGWIRKEAVDPLDSLALVPVKDPTPTPPPPTPTVTQEPSPTASPTTNPNAPDFAPNNAILIDGGAKLRVTVINLSTNNYDGPLVVGVAKVGVTSPQVVVDGKVPANGSVSVDFELNPPITQAGNSVQVTVDPGNAVKESNEDNNSATFMLTPPAEPFRLTIQSPTIGQSTITVRIENQGGEMRASEVTVQVSLPSDTTTKTESALALAKGQTHTFEVTRPSASGTGTITVLVDGEPAASIPITLD